MQSKPKYKVCKRLGPGVYDQCQTQKFALAEARTPRGGRGGKRRGRRGGSEFGLQLLEKQRVRTMYGVSEKQFARYIAEALAHKGGTPHEFLYRELERRLDNAVYRAGIAPTRRAARQLVSHGHFMVNGKKVRVPSFRLSEGDVVSVRDGSKDKVVFQQEKEEGAAKVPGWLRMKGKTEASVQSTPVLDDTYLYDLSRVLEFYSR